MTVYQNGELVLYGYVGDNFWDEGFTSSEVLAALAEHGRDNDLVVRLNSGGGIIDDGVAIYNALSAHKGSVRIEIDAIAASSASVIAMAGDTIVMKAGAIMMIHDPANVTFGTIDDHQKTIEQLTAYAAQMASIYSERSGNEAEAVRADMKAEIWMTAAQAVEKGYADEAEAAKAKAVAAFDYRVYAKAPKDLRSLARKKNWSFETDSQAATSAAETRHPEENPMTDKERADALAAQVTELEAKLKSGKDADATAALTKELEELRAKDQARENTDAIMALEEAKGNEAQAKALADAGVKPDAAKAILAAAPKAESGGNDRRRLNGEGLTGGGAPSAKGDKTVLADAVARTNKRR